VFSLLGKMPTGKRVFS